MTDVESYITSICTKIIGVLKIFQKGCVLKDSPLPSLYSSFDGIPHYMVDVAGIEELKSFEAGLNTLESDCDDTIRKYIYFASICFQDRWRSAFQINLNIQLCKYHLRCGATNSFSYPDLKKVFRNVYEIIRQLLSNKRVLVLSKSSAIFLCLYQIKSILPFLMSAIEHKSVFTVNYASRCLSECLDCVSKEVCERSELPCSEFLDLMDCVLTTLDGRLSINQLNEVKEQVDELLCHAMATAQVAVLGQDQMLIKLKSQAVLQGLDGVKIAVLEENKKEKSFSVNVLSDALCAMERSVNTAVLRLVLHICSGIKDPLKALVDFCKPSTETLSKRHQSDLDDHIIDFDIFMDRLIQIGSFAVSCSSNVKKAMQLRSCLASFESLEAEVVPCVTAFYMDPIKTNRISLLLLLNRWKKEISTYRFLINSIVDPAAYVQIVFLYLKEQNSVLEDCNNETFIQKVNEMTKASQSLNPIIATTIEQDSLYDRAEVKVSAKKIMKTASNCQQAVKKLQGSNNKLLTMKVKKLAVSLITEVERLWDVLTNQLLDTGSNVDTLGVKFDSTEAKEYYKLCDVDVQEPTYSENVLLSPIIAKGKECLREAVLYNTPKRSTIRRPVMKTPISRPIVRATPRPSTVRSKCFRTPANRTKSENDAMELTDLLEQLSKLDDTFNDFTDDKTLNGLHPPCGKRLFQLFDTMDIDITSDSPEMGSSDCDNSSEIGNIHTFERKRDLELVNIKIESLKTTDDQHVTVINIP